MDNCIPTMNKGKTFPLFKLNEYIIKSVLIFLVLLFKLFCTSNVALNHRVKRCFWVASTDATHIFVWIWGSNMAAFPVMVPDFFIL